MTTYIETWIKKIQKQYDYWFDQYPVVPVINPEILSHNLTSCCQGPGDQEISFAHFPEPYYGNPDDDVRKSAVVLFYNPGPMHKDQLRYASEFLAKYESNNCNYNELSSNFCFVGRTIKDFITPKTKQINSLLSDIRVQDTVPLFMDLIPWHSTKFKGIDVHRYSHENTLKEAKEMVFIPAILNAVNTDISQYVNTLKNSCNKNKIILFAIGAKYSSDELLELLGFKDITNRIQLMNNPFPNLNPPENLHYTLLSSKGEISIDLKSKIRIWSVMGSEFIKGFDSEELQLSGINNKEIFIINTWTLQQDMNIPHDNYCNLTLKHILQTL